MLPDKMKVLASPYLELADANPFQKLLYEAMERYGTRVAQFKTRRLIDDRWHIWHLHWPEGSVLNSCSSFVAAYRLAKFWCQLKMARWRGVKIVWTAHNLRPHELKHPALEKLFWFLFIRNIHGVICMTHSSQTALFAMHSRARRLSAFVIPHGHYRGVYPSQMSQAQARRALGIGYDERVIAFVGQIRPYKGVPELIRHFQSAELADTRLIVAGSPVDKKLRDALTAAAAGLSNVTLYLRFIAAAELQKFFRAADVIVLPFTEILNSGSAILALSFDRPILVPAKGALVELQSLAGKDWVMLYEQLRAAVLANALKWACSGARSRAGPPLETLDWTNVARATIDAFCSLIRTEVE